VQVIDLQAQQGALASPFAFPCVLGYFEVGDALQQK